MAERTRVIISSLGAGATDTTDIGPIPSGKRFIIKEFGAGGVVDTDNRSSLYLLQWGTVGSFEDIRAISVSGTTVCLNIGKEFTGDGAKFLRITRVNTSITAKRCPVWVVAFDA
jgi:hypothetical protein